MTPQEAQNRVGDYLLANPQHYQSRDLLINFLLSYEAGKEEDGNLAEDR